MLEVRPVRTPRERRAFLTFPWRVYRNDPLWVPPLLPQRARQIDPERGPFFRQGTAEFFLAWRGGQPVGTICAAEDPSLHGPRGEKTCVFGFFEYLDDPDVPAALVEEAAAWGRRRGLVALWGPFNLDYEDGYGVLVDGWERPPALLCGHSPRYYRPTMERLGFLPDRAENIALDIALDAPELARLERAARVIRRRGRVVLREADLNGWEGELDRLRTLLNTALAHLTGHIDWSRERLMALIDQFRRVADPELVLFAEIEGETAGFLPGLPDVNEVLRHVNGLRFPWDYLRLWWHGRRRPSGLTVKSVLVLPRYWKSGVALVLFAELLARARAKGYRRADLSITSVDNPDTVALATHLGARIYKRWQVYYRPIGLAPDRS